MKACEQDFLPFIYLSQLDKNQVKILSQTQM